MNAKKLRAKLEKLWNLRFEKAESKIDHEIGVCEEVLYGDAPVFGFLGCLYFDGTFDEWVQWKDWARAQAKVREAQCRARLQKLVEIRVRHQEAQI